MATTPTTPSGIRRRSSSFFFRHPKTRRGLTLAAPLSWMVVVYLVSLLLLLANAFWRVDSLTSTVVRDWGWRNFDTVFSGNWHTAFLEKTYYLISSPHGGHGRARDDRRPRLRIPDRLLRGSGGVAARTVGDDDRGGDPPVGERTLVRVFAWKAMLEGGGPAEAFFHAIGLTDVSLTGTTFAMWLTFCYLWLPFAILADLRLARARPGLARSTRRVTWEHIPGRRSGVWLPLAVPGIVDRLDLHVLPHPG